MDWYVKDKSLNFVLCPSFHGATLLSILLNAHPDIVALGDTVPKWEQICACQEKVLECDFWHPILEAIKPYQSSGSWVLNHLPEFFDSSAMNRNASLMLAAMGLVHHKLARAAGGDRLATYLAGHQALRLAALKQTGASIFVDGQKSLTKALLHKGAFSKDIPVRIIHLTRDPRGFLASDKRSNRFRNLETSARQWKAGHNRIALLTKRFLHMDYFRIRYEDICASPENMADKLQAFLGARPHKISDLKKKEEYHLLGNKMLHHFDGRIRLSTKWKEELTSAEAVRMLHLTRPLSQEFGYV